MIIGNSLMRKESLIIIIIIIIIINKTAMHKIKQNRKKTGK